jgi:hypothetical protein
MSFEASPQRQSRGRSFRDGRGRGPSACWLLFCYSCLLAIAGAAGAAPPGAHEVSLRASSLLYRSPSGGQFAVGLGYRRMLLVNDRPALELGGGVAVATGQQRPEFPFEAHLKALVVARLGAWQAAAGPEVGLSTLTVLHAREGQREWIRREQLRVGPAYLAFNAEPVRLQFGPVRVSALELQIGAGMAPWGHGLRLQLGFIRVGYVP